MLIWDDDNGIGFEAPSEERAIDLYDEEYFNEYVRRGQSGMGVLLNECRVEWVRKYHDGPVLDVGSGAGDFLRAMEDESVGTDVLPEAMTLLYDNQKEWRGEPMTAMTFWDSFEHIIDHSAYLDRCMKWAFLSLPIFPSKADVLSSKHYKPHEHVWYFRGDGLESYLNSFGFEFRAYDNFETRLGREAIVTYTFERM